MQVESELLSKQAQYSRLEDKLREVDEESERKAKPLKDMIAMIEERRRQI